MSYKQWVKKLKDIRKELYGETSSNQDNNMKFQSKKEELIDTICSELEKVKEIFEETGIPEEVPKITLKRQNGVSLHFPIVRYTTRYSSFIDFGLERTENGVGVRVKYIGYDQLLTPPIKVQSIREIILEYLEQRHETIRKIEKKY